MRFLLRTTNEEEGVDSDTEDEEEHTTGEQKSVKEAINAFRHAKKTKKRRKMLENAKKDEKRQRKQKKKMSRKECNLEAIRMIYDPQSLSDRLFGLLDGKKNERFALRLLRMALLARLIGLSLYFLTYSSFRFRRSQTADVGILFILAKVLAAKTKRGYTNFAVRCSSLS